MIEISVEKTNGSIFEISQMSVKRDWMDATSERHAYRCFPVTQANVVGWSLACTKDIVFTWDGINDQTPDHFKIVSPIGAYAGRGQSSVSFNTGLIFRTAKDVSLLTINPVNCFNDDFETMSNFISTSFFDSPLPLAIKAKKASVETRIIAGTPIATIIPISLTELNNSSINIREYSDPENLRQKASADYGAAAQKINVSGKFTDWLRDAVNEKNESLGSHEVKVLRLHVNDTTKPKTDISSWHTQGE
jgi:hypothetical protein